LRAKRGSEMAKRRLKTLEDIRRYLSHLILSIESGNLEPGTGGRLAYIASILIRAIEGSELEKRVEELETALSKEKKSKPY
jgi:hypothetical protein